MPISSNDIMFTDAILEKCDETEIGLILIAAIERFGGLGKAAQPHVKKLAKDEADEDFYKGFSMLKEILPAQKGISIIDTSDR